MRTEQQIFDDLATVCGVPGFVHATAFLCFRDNIVGYGDELKGEDYAKLFSWERLIRTEMSTLIGLMARAPIDYSLPPQDKIAELIGRAEALLQEIHNAMLAPFDAVFRAALKDEHVNPFTTAGAMREPIFYSGEAAYTFQYRDLVPKKYGRDDDWLLQNKGFSASDAKQVVQGIRKLQEDKLLATLRVLKGVPMEKWTVLDGFTFTSSEVAAITKQPAELVTKVLSAFTLAGGNPSFTSLQEFNATNAYPLLTLPDGRHLLLQYGVQKCVPRRPLDVRQKRL